MPVRTSNEALTLIELTHQAGLASYLQVLTADGRRCKRASAPSTRRYSAPVALLVAPGGGRGNRPATP